MLLRKISLSLLLMSFVFLYPNPATADVVSEAEVVSAVTSWLN